MRIYVAGGMSGVPDFEENFQMWSQRLKDSFPGAIICDPSKLVPKHMSWLEGLRICCMATLDTCSHIFMIPGFETSAGANIEYIQACQAKKKYLQPIGDGFVQGQLEWKWRVVYEQVD